MTWTACHYMCLAAAVASAASSVATSAEQLEHSSGGSSSESQGQDGDLGQLWHLFSRDMQHTLAHVIESHSEAEEGGGALEDPGVNALLSGLLHDELEERQQKAEVATAAQLAEWERQEEARQRAEEVRAAREAEERRAARARREAELGTKRAAQRAEAERERAQHEEEMQRMQDEATATRRDMEGRMEVHRQAMEVAKKRHAQAQDEHAKRWDRLSGVLRKVHADLEDLTGGWRDVPFWDDFFRSTSTSQSWGQLALGHLNPALEAIGLSPSHSVLFLEPGRAGLAERLAAALRRRQPGQGAAYVYGEEEEGHHDVVVEVGLLDAMAMGGSGDDGRRTAPPRLEALRGATARLASLVKPGGTWLCISVVPPTLRTPLLGRLAGRSFASTGTHTITLAPPEAEDADTAASSPPPRGALRGSSFQTQVASQVANMLLYGSTEAQIWAYSLRRASTDEEEAAAAGGTSANVDDMDEKDGILGEMIRQQRPGKRDDL